MKISSTNNITRKVGIIVALKFENCNINKMWRRDAGNYINLINYVDKHCTIT
jgi:hypothetical protein